MVKLCNKCELGIGCIVVNSENRIYVIFGISDKCIVIYFLDMVVVMIVLGVKFVFVVLNGEKRIFLLCYFYCMSGNIFYIENNLKEGELIIVVILFK